MSEKYVYMFSEGNGKMRELLGGKGANLAEMTNLGMPVPQGFTITTEACNKYYDDGEKIAPEVMEQVHASLKKLEDLSGKKLGDPANPLLVSVRSGARASMPGMMDTILNLGINDEVVKTIAERTGNERFAYDSYRRFIQMFSDVVMELPKHEFEVIIDEMKEAKGVKQDTELDAEDLKQMVVRFKEFYRENLHGDLPGVAFTRNPATGEKKLFGEFLMNAQGEDVVAGVRTPQTIDQLKEVMPGAYNDFVEICNKLENHYKDMQDMEFTIENEKLYMLQTRNGKRTATAALKVACDMVNEGLVTTDEALMMVDPKQLDSLLHPQFDANVLKNATPITSGLPASPGAACGQIVFSADDAVREHNNGKKVVLVRLETSPEDIEGMAAAEGILTVRGGMTSHAAVVARGMGECCVSGCGDIKMDYANKKFILNGKEYHEFDWISLDGSTGNVYGEAIPTVPATISGDFETFMKWADDRRRLKVRTNADTPRDAKQAVEFGAEGIGLTRTEHMFFDGEKIKAIREMIVAPNAEARKAALEKVLPLQREDFEGIYEAMQGYPVTVRYLDPPLHEFVPTKKEDIEELARDMNMSVEELNEVISGLHEVNPMMGHRGCRLAVTYPEIAETQTRAVIEAAINVQRRHPEWKMVPEIMIPLVVDVKELKFVKDIVTSTADKIIAESDVKIEYHVGTMIEDPRAAVLADEIASEAVFFSFGTNDLTQLTYGFSRDDAGKFLDSYYDAKIFEQDPFARLDQHGVGKLMATAVKLGRQTRPDIKLGICGEHGGDPSSIEFCEKLGLSYVSCSPYRVPIARLAAAQAVIKNEDK